MSEYETELFKRLDAAESEIENLKEFIHKDGLRIAMFIQNEAIAECKINDLEGYLFDATELIQEAYEQYMEIICYGTTDASLSTQPFRRFLDKMEKRNEGK